MAINERAALFAVPALAVGLGLAAGQRTSHAAGEDPTEARERCATRIAITFTGESPSDELLKSADPKSAIDTMLKSPKFIERFARFVNAQYNRVPGDEPLSDSAYWQARWVLENDRPYKDMFVAQTRLDDDGDGNVTVVDDTEGLGYFRSDRWLKRYAGNEVSGLKIVTAYRIMNNVIGLKLVATTNAPGADVTATGRAAPACAGCHYDPWYALDKVAKVLSRRSGTGDDISFVDAPATDLPQSILGGKNISNDKELVTALVESDTFRFAQCRLAFSYLYDRPEDECEGPVFDKCMSAFSSDGKIQTALATIAKDQSFCE